MRNDQIARIRIERPEGKWGRWVIRVRHNGYEHALAGRDLRETIAVWRYARQRGKCKFD